MGEPLMFGKSFSSDNASLASGFLIIQLADEVRAEALCDKLPHLGEYSDCSLAIHAYAPMPGGGN